LGFFCCFFWGFGVGVVWGGRGAGGGGGGEVKSLATYRRASQSSVEILSEKRTLNLIHVTFLESPFNDFVSSNTVFLSSERHCLWLQEVSQGYSKHLCSNVRFNWTVYHNA